MNRTTWRHCSICTSMCIVRRLKVWNLGLISRCTVERKNVVRSMWFLRIQFYLKIEFTSSEKPFAVNLLLMTILHMMLRKFDLCYSISFHLYFTLLIYYKFGSKLSYYHLVPVELQTSPVYQMQSVFFFCDFQSKTQRSHGKHVTGTPSSISSKPSSIVYLTRGFPECINGARSWQLLSTTSLPENRQKDNGLANESKCLFQLCFTSVGESRNGNGFCSDITLPAKPIV